MLKNYVPLLGLLVLLAGCYRSEQPAETAESRASAAAAPASSSSNGAQTANQVELLAQANATSASALPAIPEATGSDASMTLLMRPEPAGPDQLVTSTAARLPTRAQQARRTTVAGQRGRRQETALTPPATPDSVATAELREFLGAQLPAGQTYSINPERDTLLVGAQGTQVLVPAGTFDLPLGAGSIRLTLQEFYTPADMVLAGLSTMAGPNLLETGGMLRLEATAGGQPVALRPGRQLLLRLPTRQPQADMQLFEGVAHGTSGALDWQLPSVQPTSSSQRKARQAAATRRSRTQSSKTDTLAKPHVRMQWPENKAFEGEIRTQLQPLVRGQRRLHRNPLASLSTRRVLATLSETYHQPIVRQLQLRFTIDSTGVLSRAEALPGSDEHLAPAAITGLQRLGRWRAARLPAFEKALPVGEPTSAVGRVSIMFTKKHGIIVNQLHWTLPRAEQMHARQLRKTVDSLVASPAFRRRYWRAQDSLAYLRMLDTQRRLLVNQANLRTQFTDTTRAAITQDGLYNELQAQGLGWINCDRFSRTRDLIVYRVLAHRQGAIVSLIFKDMNSVLSAQMQDETQTFFANVPYNYPATVVALRREKGVLYLAKHDVRLGNDPLLAFDFKPVTVAEMRAALKR